MPVMIKLRLSSPNPTLDDVRALAGAAGLNLDEEFGVVCIGPAESLFVVRVDAVNDIEGRRRASPEILEAYGDVRIGAFEESPTKKRK